MKYLKKFENQSEVSTFNPEIYLDYLLSEISEEHLIHKESTEKLLSLIYNNISAGESDRIKRYLNGPRFEDCIVLMEYEFGSKTASILLIDRFFYSRNQKWLYRNIKWVEHPLHTQFKRWQNMTSKSTVLVKDILPGTGMSTTFKNAYKAEGLPENISLIKGIKNKVIEFWPQPDYDDPICFFEDSPLEIIELQFYLFKYLGN